MTVQNLKLRVPVNFPSRAVGAAGISAVKSNGVWTIKIDPSALSDIVPTTDEQASSLIIYTDILTGFTGVISIQELVNLVTIGATAPRVITSGSAIAVDTADTFIVLNKLVAGATSIALPPVASRVPLGLPLEIYDFAGNAGPMTITPNGSETIMGASGAWTVLSGGSPQTGGAVRLIPSVGLNGWLLK